MLQVLASLLAVSLLTYAPPTWAGVVTPASCSSANVQTAIDAANEGDTVIIPAGTCSWTTTVTVGTAAPTSKSLTILGSGPGVTIIDHDVPNAGPNNSRTVFTFYTVNGKYLRLSHLTIRGATVNPAHYAIRVQGTGRALRIDNVTFTTLKGSVVRIGDAATGVLDNNTFTITVGENFPIEIAHNDWPGAGGESASNGHGSWASPLHLGGADALYIEDNVFSEAGAATGPAISDCDNGGRFIIRFNTVTNLNTTTHGTEGGNTRGCVKAEIYHNSFDSSAGSNHRWFHNRGGNGVFFNNVATGSYHFVAGIAHYRTDHDYGTAYFKCTGQGNYDNNDGTVYATGTHSGPPENTKTLQVAGTPWTVNQWRGYSLKNVGTGLSAFIQSNTSNTATIALDHVDAGLDPVWNSGNTYEFRRASQCLDQVGYAGGVLMSGVPPAPAAWPGQTLTPFYLWNNTIGGVQRAALKDVELFVEDRDYYNEANATGSTTCAIAFDGTCGVGRGTLASRSATCTVGVAYFSTDQGAWYTGGPASGRLSRCVATDTWADSYTPFSYKCPVAGCNATGRHTSCTQTRGCGHPLRWTNSVLNVASRGAVATRPAVSTSPAVTTRPNSE